MKRKWVAALAAIAVCWPVTAFAASLQSQLDALQVQIDNIVLTPGPQGATGPQGPTGPQGATGATGPEAPAGPSVGGFQLTVASSPTNGDITTAEWNNECVALGGRPATTKDILNLPWDPAAIVTEPSSWVRPFIVASDGTDVIDITGIQGKAHQDLACGSFSSGTFWSNFGELTTGLVAFNGVTAFADCNAPHPVTCVVPLP